jgi:hypothetical protein
LDPLALALEVPFCCLIQVWHVLVDELNGELGPCCIVSIANSPDEGFFYGESGRRVIPEQILACTWEVKNDIDGFIVWGLFVGRCFFCMEGELPEASEVAPVGFQDKGLGGCVASSFVNTVVYPASANFGMLTSVEHNPGNMFISLAAGQSFCFRRIFFMALFVRLSRNMNIFLDSSPVSSKASSSSSGAAPDFAPVSRISVFHSLLLITFCVQCAVTLLTGLVTVVVVVAMSMLVVVSISNVSYCSLTRQDSGDQ